MNEATEPPTEAAFPLPAAEVAPEAIQIPVSEAPHVQDVEPAPVSAPPAPVPEVQSDAINVTAAATTEETPIQATEALPAPVSARGRGRGRGRGSKRGSAPTSAAATNSTASGTGRGRGKRKSEGAPSAVADVAAAREPRKKRKVAMNSKRIVESGSDEDGDSAMYEDSTLPASAAAAAVEEATPVEPEQSTSTMQVDEPASTTQPEATATPAVEEVKVQEPVRKQSLKVKLGFKRGSTSGQTESPIDGSTGEVAATSNTAEPASTAQNVIAATTSATQEPSSLSIAAESSGVQEASSKPTKKEEIVAVPDLFADDEVPVPKPPSSQSKKSPSIPVDKVPTPPSAETMSPKIADKPAKTKTSTNKIAAPSSMEKKPSTSGGTPTSKSAAPPKKPQPASKTINSLNKTSTIAKGSSTPAGASPGGGGLIKKRVPRPSVGGTSTPKTQQHAPAPAPPAETSFLDALFADTIPQTDHERQLQREREERSRKEAAAKAKKAKEDADARKKASLAASAAASAASAAGLVPAGGKPPPVGLPNLKTIPAQRQPGTSVLSRLGGSERLRQQEIAKMRVEARQQQEKLAAEGGFDLLSQGIEMGAFEVPFLREWRSHQGMIFSNAREGEPFHFYKGAPPKNEENGEVGPAQLRSLPHPWTFGSAFAFAGSKSEQQEQWK